MLEPDRPLRLPEPTRLTIQQVGRRFYVFAFTGPRGAPESVAGPFASADRADAELRTLRERYIARATRPHHDQA